MTVTSLPLLNQKMFAPYKVLTLVEVVVEQGLPASIVLANTGITQEALVDPKTLTSVRQYITACENVIAAKVRPSTAFEVGARMHLSAYGMYGYALMCSLKLRDYFDFGVKYHLLATPTLRIAWREEAKAAVWEFHEVYGQFTSEALRKFLMQQQMAQHVTHLRDAAGPDCSPLKAMFSLPEPQDRSLYESYLGCSCHFSQSASELHYPAALLDQAPQLANRLTSTLMQETCDRLIGRAKTSLGFAGEVYQQLMLTPSQFPGMDIIAARIHVTERTLRRKLDAEGTSYAAILDDVRRSLATEYLQTTRMSIDDIAAKVGYSDSSNFRRSYKRWTGMTPREVREQSTA